MSAQRASRSSSSLTARSTRILSALGLSLFIMASNGCEGPRWNEAKLASDVKSRGELRVLTLPGVLIDVGRATATRKGLERALLTHFAESYDLKIRFIRKQNVDDLFEALRTGEGDLAAGRLWGTEQSDGLRPGPAFDESRLSLFCSNRAKVHELRDLDGKRVGLAGKDNVDELDARLRQLVPGVILHLHPEASGTNLIQAVGNAQLDCAIAEHLEGQLEMQVWQDISFVMDLTKPMPLAWMMRADRSDLPELLHAWFQRASRDDEIMRIEDHYFFSGASPIDRADVRRFLASLKTRLPEYNKAFHQYADEYHLDWRLLAAVAYQESHWDADATSTTGVKGLMQLTVETATHVGIDDRLDPQQSIWGGAYYLRALLNQMPKNIDSQDRLAMALAAYNCGLAHLHDAEALAVERGLNPHSWRHLKQVLPLLEDPEIARDLPYGTARGNETVEFVERVRAFLNLWEQV